MRIKVLGRPNSVNVQKIMWCAAELNLDVERIDIGGQFGGSFGGGMGGGAPGFDPSRFTDADTVKARPAGSYMPFSAGSRKCIGDRFAEAEMAVVLGQLLRRFELRRADGHDPGRRPSVTLGPEHGTPIVLTRRPS